MHGIIILELTKVDFFLDFFLFEILYIKGRNAV